MSLKGSASESADPLLVTGVPVAVCERCGQPLPDSTTGCSCHNVYFYDSKAGIYFTYKVNDIKVALVRSLMRLLLLFMFFVLYVVFWGVSDVAILGLTVASCAGTFVGLNFLSVSCWGGFFAVLVRGITLGSQFASVTIHWKA